MVYDPTKPLYLQTANAKNIKYDERGVPYSIDYKGNRLYHLDYKISPKPKLNFFREADWDPKTGTWHRNMDWNKVLATTIGGVIAAPAVAAVAGAAGGSAAGGSVAATGGGAAAGTGTAAAGATGGTVAGGSMGWLGPILNYGVPAATNLISNRMQNSADRDAAEINAKFLREALEVEKEKERYQRGLYANYLERLRPYQEAGRAAVGRASNLLTTSSYRPEAGMSGGGRQGGPGLVALKDSSGVVRHVPEAEADKYLQLGAMRA